MNDQVAYESTDAGETWNAKSLPGINIGSITSFEFSHDDEKIAWLTIGGFGNTRVFKTINSGTTWTDISGNLVVKHALVFLSSSDVARITKPNPT
jgi:photosystem II stability/assembly factor-like uncharacterized protein